MIKNIFFDLDGTLTDPEVGITKSVAYALDRFGIYVADISVLKVFIGPPLTNSFEYYFDFTKEQADEAVQVYREYFSEYGIFENEVYDGIPELLSKLKDQGKKLCLATSKPEKFAREILEHFDLDKYFDVICGNTMEETRSEKIDVIEHIFEMHPEFNREETVMIGDRCYDIKASKQAGIKSIGVQYGFAEEKELDDADYLASDVSSLASLLETI